VDRLHGILVFLRVVEHGTLSGAARVLGVSTAAVSASVTRLERQLGVRLLNRTTRKVSTTPEGAEYYARCKQITTDLAEAERAIARAARVPGGRLKVRLPLTLGRMWIVPRLPEFLRQHPALSLEVVCMDFVPYTMEEGVDLSVQTGELQDSSLAVRRLATAGYAVCASPAYFRRRGRPGTPQDLRDHACIAYRRPRNGRIREWRFRYGEDTRLMPIEGSLTFNRIEHMIEAAIAGHGLIQVPECYAHQAIAGGALALALEDYRAGGYEISAVYRQQQRRVPNVRAFMDFVAGLFDPPPW